MSKAELKWLSFSEAKQRVAAAKARAISEFKKRFPRADISRFEEEVQLDANRKATATVLFTESDGSQTDPLIKKKQILVTTSQRRSGVSSRWWISCSAITNRCQIVFGVSNCFWSTE